MSDTLYTRLIDWTDQVFVVAHREDTSLLEKSLVNQGFRVQVVRGPYTDEQKTFSLAMKCLVNHANVWRLVVNSGRPAVVVEADFVPVTTFGLLPGPTTIDRFTYLYACGPTVWDIDNPCWARGHAGATVAYCLSPEIAKKCLEFFVAEMVAESQGGYRPWDASIGYWLKERGIESYIPYRHYGEHGGIVNREHPRAGLGGSHRADLLYGKLEFLPFYAKGSRVNYFQTRFLAITYGLLRTITGRLLAWHDLSRASDRTRTIRFVLGRFMLNKPGIRKDRGDNG